MPTAQPETNALAIISLVFGILSWILLPFIGSVVAVIAGHRARRQIARDPFQQGDGLALAGLILGWVQLALLLPLLLLFFLFVGAASAIPGIGLLISLGLLLVILTLLFGIGLG